MARRNAGRDPVSTWAMVVVLAVLMVLMATISGRRTRAVLRPLPAGSALVEPPPTAHR